MPIRILSCKGLRLEQCSLVGSFGLKQIQTESLLPSHGAMQTIQGSIDDKFLELAI